MKKQKKHETTTAPQLPDQTIPQNFGHNLFPQMKVGANYQLQGIVVSGKMNAVLVTKKGAFSLPESNARENFDKYVEQLVIVDGAWTGQKLVPSKIDVLEDKVFAQRFLNNSVGKKVTIEAILWSMNGNWWIGYRGIKLGIKGTDTKKFTPSSHHAGFFQFTGELSIEKHPSLDQIALKPERDLTETYMLKIESIKKMLLE